MTIHGFGYALYEPEPFERLRPGMLGYFDDDRRWALGAPSHRFRRRICVRLYAVHTAVSLDQSTYASMTHSN